MAYSQTEVPVERSQGEIRRLLHAHDAANFSFGEGAFDGTLWALVEFVHHDQLVRIRVPLKALDPRVVNLKVQRATSRTRQQIVDELVEQESRRIWRVLFHGLKARLVSVEEGVETFEQAFLAHLVDPATNQTLWEQAKHLIEAGVMRHGGPGLAGPLQLDAGAALRIVVDDDDIVDAEVVG